MVAFELLTGTKPFEAESFAAQARAHVEDDPPRASEREIDVPPAVDRVLERGMAKEPAERWETTGAMVQALDDALATPPPRRRAATRTGPTRALGAPPPRRGWGAGVLVAVAALLLAAAGGVAFLTSGGGGEPRDQPTAQREPERTSTPDATRSPEPTPTEEPATATPAPTEESPEATPPPAAPEQDQGGGGAVSGDDPTALQLRAYELNNAGDPERALAFAEKAVQLCDGSDAVSPCAYALYEYARALRLTGDPGAAVAALEERIQRFPDNQPGTVRQELERAREAAGQID